MTFQPVLPAVMLLVIALALIMIRLITSYQLQSSSGAGWATVWRWCGLTLAILLMLIAAMRPGLAGTSQQAAGSTPAGENVNVFFVVDRSVGSGVSDYGDTSRMDGIRADIATLIGRYPHARFALIGFSSRASLDWPLSEDAWSLQPIAARLAPYNEPNGAPEADAGAAANVLRYQLIAAGQQYRDSANMVFYFGSGAAGSAAPQGEFETGARTVDGGAVFGYGEPGALPATFDEARLKQVAAQLGVDYVHRRAAEPLPQIARHSNPSVMQQVSTADVPGRTELYWVFTLPASVLLLFEFFLTTREIRRTRIARRGVSP